MMVLEERMSRETLNAWVVAGISYNWHRYRYRFAYADTFTRLLKVANQSIDSGYLVLRSI